VRLLTVSKSFVSQSKRRKEKKTKTKLNKKALAEYSRSKLADTPFFSSSALFWDGLIQQL
jgi:hypothetical protein